MFFSVSVQALLINTTWPLIPCQNPFTCQIPTPEKSTKQNLSLKQKIWPRTQMWWQEQGTSAFPSTRATAGTAGRRPRPLSTAPEVSKERVWRSWELVPCHFLPLFSNSNANGCTKTGLRWWFNQLQASISQSSLVFLTQPVLHKGVAWAAGVLWNALSLWGNAPLLLPFTWEVAAFNCI